MGHVAACIALALASLLLASCEGVSRRRFEPALSASAPSRVASSKRADAGTNGGYAAACVRAGRRCDIADVSCQRELYAVVQCLYGTTEGTRPAVRFVSTAALAEEIRANERRLEQERAALEYAARRLGLSAEPTNTPPDSTWSPNAYYAAGKNEILVVERDAIRTDGELAWLILGHEYVHALQNRKHELERALGTRHERSFDRELALFAGVEGEAALFEQVLRALHHGKQPERWALDRFEAETRSSDDAVLGQSRVLESSFGTFPYSYGAYGAARRWIDAPDARLDLGSVPASTYELLARRYDWALEDTVRAARAWPACADGRPPVLGRVPVKESLGAWLIQAFVRKQTRDAEQARSVASALRGDSLAVYAAGGSDHFSFVWRTAWASPGAAHTMGDLVEARLRASEPGGGDMAVRAEGDALVAIVLGPGSRSLPAAELAALELAVCER